MSVMRFSKREGGETVLVQVRHRWLAPPKVTLWNSQLPSDSGYAGERLEPLIGREEGIEGLRECLPLQFKDRRAGRAS